MGTRADFYVGRGEEAEWLGSIAWDGSPGCIPREILVAADEEGYRKAVAAFLADRRVEKVDEEASKGLGHIIRTGGDSTLPEDGWPWPWTDSRTTDYAYAFDWGKTWASGFGYKWFDPLLLEDKKDTQLGGRTAVFPNMRGKQKVTLGPRSGLMVFGVGVGKG